jgi:hypothetical protein
MGAMRNAVVPQESEQQIFGEHQADDTPASRAQGHTHGHLALAGAATSEHEICGVAADRQQQQQHDALQNGQPADHQTLRAARRLPEGENLTGDSGVGLGKVASKLGHRGGELGLGLFARRAGLQQTE